MIAKGTDPQRRTRKMFAYCLEMVIVKCACAGWMGWEGGFGASTTTNQPTAFPFRKKKTEMRPPFPFRTNEGPLFVGVHFDYADRTPRGSLRAVGHAERARAVDNVCWCRFRLLRLRRCVSIIVALTKF